ncbi:MAG: PD40 domain-containing protein [Deltaproteobacteria bacterium]|nr:PD40 domain-containing protein [Deltaproteobacteria bacterium]
MTEASGDRQGGEHRFPLLIGLQAFRLLAVSPATLLLIVVLAQTVYLVSPDLPRYGEYLRLVGYGALALAGVLVVSPLALIATVANAAGRLRRAIAARACDVWVGAEGIRVVGGPAHGFSARWAELADGGVQRSEAALRLRGSSGAWLDIPWPADPDERASVETLVATITAHAAVVAAGAAAPPRRVASEQIECFHCGAPLRPTEAASVACGHCGTDQPVPREVVEKVRAMGELARDRRRDHRLAATLVHQRGAPVANVVALGGGLLVMALGVVALVLTVAFLFTDGQEAGMPRLGGLGLVIAGICLALLAGVRWSLAERRALRLLTIGFAALEPAQAGAPPQCRECGASLPDPGVDSAIARCVYCHAPNVMTADLRLDTSLVERFTQLGASPYEVLAGCGKQRRRARFVAGLGAAMLCVGAAWLWWDNQAVPLDRSAAAKIPFDEKVSQNHIGEVTAGSGAHLVEQTASLGEGVRAWLVPGDEAPVDAVVVGRKSRLVRDVSQPLRTLEKLAGVGRAWPWARRSDGTLVWVTHRGITTRNAKGKRRVLYPQSWHDDSFIIDLAPGPGPSVLATTRATERGHFRIRQIDRDRSTQVLIHDAREPALSPNGKRLAFAQLLDERWQVVVAPLSDLGDRRLITRGRGHAAFPTWSPDGSRLAFLTRTVRDATYFNKRYGEAHLWVTDLDGEAVQLTGGASLVLSPPVWRAEGLWVLGLAMGEKDLATQVWRVVPR